MQVKMSLYMLKVTYLNKLEWLRLGVNLFHE